MDVFGTLRRRLAERLACVNLTDSEAERSHEGVMQPTVTVARTGADHGPRHGRLLRGDVVIAVDGRAVSRATDVASLTTPIGGRLTLLRASGAAAAAECSRRLLRRVVAVVFNAYDD